MPKSCKMKVILFAVLIWSVNSYVWGDCVDYFDYGDDCQTILRLYSPGTSWLSSNIRFESGAKWGDWALSAPDNGTGDAGDLYYYDGDDDKLRFIIKDDGKIGIGTATPTADLDVIGDVVILGNVLITDTTNLQGLQQESRPSNGFVKENGYIGPVALTSGAPPTDDCDENAEWGRMKVDSKAELLYICVDSGWVSK